MRFTHIVWDVFVQGFSFRYLFYLQVLSVSLRLLSLVLYAHFCDQDLCNTIMASAIVSIAMLAVLLSCQYFLCSALTRGVGIFRDSTCILVQILDFGQGA